MTTFPRQPFPMDRQTSLSSHRTSLTPSSSTAPRNSTTTPPRTPSPYLQEPPSPKSIHHTKSHRLPSIRIHDDEDEAQHDDQGGLKRRNSLERTRTWAQEVERNRKRTERKGKERAKAQENDKSPYGQPFWSVSTEVIDSLVEALTPSSSEFAHLPSAAQVIAANRRRSYRIDSDSDEHHDDDDEDEGWWNEQSYSAQTQKRMEIEKRSTSMRLEIVQPKPRERRRSERSRKTSRSDRRDESGLTDLLQTIPSPTKAQHLDRGRNTDGEGNSQGRLPVIPLLASPVSPTTPNTPTRPTTSTKIPIVPILSIDDIIRKHSPGVMSAENEVKEKARKEIEEIRPRLNSIRPSAKTQPSGDKQDPQPTNVTEEMEASTKIESVTAFEVDQLSSSSVRKTDGPSRSRKISFIEAPSERPPPVPSRTHSLPNAKPILRKAQSTQNTPQKRASTQLAKSIATSQDRVGKNQKNESLESLSQEAKMTSALLDQLEQLEKTSTIASESSTPSSSRRISFQVTSPAKTYNGRPLTPTRNKLSKRKSMPESTLYNISQSSPSKLRSELETEAENLNHAIYLRSKNLNKTKTIPRPYPEKPLNVSFAEVGVLTGNPVLIFLGLGCVRYLISLFDDIAKAFNLRLICIDRWGYGKTSQVPEAQRTPSAWADIVERVLGELGIKEFQILAHSAGSPYALATALKMPERIIGKVHLLAPWVSADIDGGYKWLKYVPNGIIKSATAAEWKLQSYLIGKPPPLKHKPISHDAKAPLSSSSSRATTPMMEEEDPLGMFRERRVSLIKSNQDLYSAGRMRTSDGQSIGLIRRASKILGSRSVDQLQEQADRSASPVSVRRVDPNGAGLNKYSSSSPTTRLRPVSQPQQDPLSSTTSSRQTSLTTPDTSLSQGPRPRSHTSSKTKINHDLTQDTNNPYLSEGFDLRSTSLDSQFVTSPVTQSVLLRNKSYGPSSKIENNSSSTSFQSEYEALDAPTGEGFTIALNQASHAECEPGTTSDLLSIILNRENRPWGFHYTDYTGGVKVYYGSEDDKISEKSMRWMERSMQDVELVIRQGEGHNLMTSLRTMWDVFESLGKEAKVYKRRTG
ncbi:uncharacterized protein I303_103552 [Kwoniella dejecticola CBS 10117]|uniref:AB hydrolase-1 domain-containing protein n=1 Tax=Kwoniella dejecticola CBS 10117 TaxID=1296121 RepID=A0A1A6A725_9TREE|nr:uncharacterized protein I303_03574 [Kwoniella dejecticola CBS 10117]OBR85860.1 hypothetical protein I303_03574 [Kwoniella dejecticola CBS 10117]